MRKRGRPLGFRLSYESKRAISESKRGQRHRQETKDKISKTLLNYFKRLSPLSDEIMDTYCKIEDIELYNWINNVREELDNTSNVMTIKSIRNSNLLEISCGDNIELFSHNITPELLLLFKEFCEESKVDPLELFDSI
jgi:succinate dehydrogenase flavin-adding protein (antitoxin of CptAB toxin-antitoxin module)